MVEDNSKHAITSRNALIFYFFLLSLAFVPLLPLFTTIQNPLPALGPLLLFCVTFFAGYFFTFTVIFRYDISVLQPFFHFQSIGSVGLAFLVLGEMFPPVTYLWIILIIVGGMLVGLDERLQPRALFSPSFGLFLLGIFCFAISDIFAAQVLNHLDVYNLKFWSSPIVLAIAAFVVPPRSGRPTINQLRPLFISTFFAFVATLLLFQAFSYNVTVSQPLAMFGSAFTLIIAAALSRFKPNLLEHHPPRIYAVRGLGIVIMLTAAIMLARV